LPPPEPSREFYPCLPRLPAAGLARFEPATGWGYNSKSHVRLLSLLLLYQDRQGPRGDRPAARLIPRHASAQAGLEPGDDKSSGFCVFGT